MFRSLSFVTVRQQHHQPALLIPLLLSGRDELIDNHLSDVYEIAKLGFPQCQSLRRSHAVTVFKTQHTLFGERTVEYFHSRLIGAELSQRNPRLIGLCVKQRHMPLAESTATAVLTGQTDGS